MDTFANVIRIGATVVLAIALVVAYATVQPGPAVSQEEGNCEYCVDLNEPDGTPTCGESPCDSSKYICCYPEIIVR